MNVNTQESRGLEWLYMKQIEHFMDWTVFLIYRCRLGDSGTTAHSFEQKGVILMELPEGFDLDAATEAAIEAGAEDVDKIIDDDETDVLQVSIYASVINYSRFVKILC